LCSAQCAFVVAHSICSSKPRLRHLPALVGGDAPWFARQYVATRGYCFSAGVVPLTSMQQQSPPLPSSCTVAWSVQKCSRNPGRALAAANSRILLLVCVCRQHR
jgi:hypothetical protein